MKDLPNAIKEFIEYTIFMEDGGEEGTYETEIDDIDYVIEFSMENDEDWVAVVYEGFDEDTPVEIIAGSAKLVVKFDDDDKAQSSKVKSVANRLRDLRDSDVIPECSDAYDLIDEVIDLLGGAE